MCRVLQVVPYRSRAMGSRLCEAGEGLSMNMQLKAYKAQVKEALEWVETEFPFLSLEEKRIIFEKALRPIWMYDSSNAVQEGKEQLERESPSSLLEKYSDVLEPVTDRRLKMSFIKDRERFKELMTDAREEGWKYDEVRRELVKV